jgi:lambda family phage portal protein
MREILPKKKSWAERVDDVIAFFSPERANKRRQHRAFSQSYRAASHTRLGRAKPINASADYHLERGYDRIEMVDRARAVERDNPIACGLLDRAVENIIGCGIMPQAKTEDAEWNAKAEELFAEWNIEADIRGLDSFYELQALGVRSYLRDGDFGTILLDSGQIQMVESDQIAAPTDKRFTPNHVDGIDLDDRGKPVSYNIVKGRGDQHYYPRRRDQVERIKIPAADFIFVARRHRLGQTRGEPCFAQSFELFDQLDGLIESVVVAARMAACFGMVITSNYPPNQLPTLTGADGKTYRDWSLEPGMVKTLQPGEEIKQVKPDHPSQNFADFMATMGRLLGLQLGLPLELVFMDFSRTNYSSARAALIQAQASFKKVQDRLITHFCRRIYLWNIERWIEDGLLEARDDWKKHTWARPAWKWIDPLKEVQANMIAVDAGMMTLSDVAKSQGRDLLELFEQRSRELKMQRDLNIPEVRSNYGRDPMETMPWAQSAESDEDSDDSEAPEKEEESDDDN